MSSRSTRAASTPGLVAFAVLGPIWGSNFLVVTWASETITPGQVTLLRVLVGFVPVLLDALARRSLRPSHARHPHHFVVIRGRWSPW